MIMVAALSAFAGTTRYLSGNPSDVHPELHGPAYHFQGGGDDVDAAFQWMIDQVRGCTDCDTKLDLVVLRASGDDDYNDYLLAMEGVDSVETLVLTSRRDAERPDVVESVKKAEIVFFAGGDQCNYVKVIKGTPVQAAVEAVNRRGGGISGTSAGLAIQGDFIYDACHSAEGTRSTEALANPYDKGISFTDDFFHWTNMQQTITEQHLIERDRMGRTLAYLARLIQDGKTKSALGVAADRETSLGIDRHGLARVLGKGPAYFILADHPPEVCLPRKHLTYSNYKIWKVDAGATFDLRNRPQSGYYLRSVTNGIISADPYAEIPCEPSADVRSALAEMDDALPQPLLDRYRAILKEHPADPATLYLYGSLLAKVDQTKDAIETLQKAEAIDPKFALPALKVASLSADPAFVREELQKVIRLCPRNFDVYRSLAATGDPDFINKNTALFRRYLKNTTAPDKLLYFPDLWTLEMAIHTGEAGDERKQIGEDVKRLSGDRAFQGLQALQVLKQGYGYLSDETNIRRIDLEIAALKEKSSAGRIGKKH